MTFTTLLVLLLQTGGLLVVSLAALSASRRAPAIRSAIGRATLLAVLALAVLSPWTRRRVRPVIPIQWNPVGSEVLSTSKAPQPAALPPSRPIAAQSVPEPVVQAPVRHLDEATIIGLLWLVGSAASSVFLGLGYWAVSRTRRHSHPVTDAAVLSALEDAARRAGIKVPSLVTSEAIGGPVVTGAFRPTIFLPPGLLASAEPDEIHAVLRHEVAHIAHGDLKWGLVHRLITIALWPQALLWALSRQMAAAAEELCDSDVLASGIPAASYADALLRLRDKVGQGKTLALGIGVTSPNRGITTRIEAILATHPRRTRVARPAALVVGAIAATTAFGATFVFAVPQAGAALTAPTRFRRTVHVLGPDGKPVTHAEAWLQITGTQTEFRKLEVRADGVHVAADNLTVHTAGMLVVHAPGLGLGLLRLWPTDSPTAELRLPKASLIVGKLRTPDGSAAANIRVRVVTGVIGEPNDEGRPFVVLAQNNPAGLVAVSDANGVFTINDVPPGSSVHCDVDDSRFAQIGFDQSVRVPDDGSPAAAFLRLRPAATISGRVMQHGQPVAGITVGAQSVNRVSGRTTAADGWGEAVTGTDGRYVINRLPGTSYNIALNLDDAQQAEFTATAHDSAPVPEGRTISNMDFDLIPGAIIEGTLLDATGKPIPGGQIGVYGPAHPRSGAWVQTTFTDAKGHYFLRVPAGEQYVYTMDQGQPDAHRVITVAGGTTTRLLLRL